jgi:tungstate transport system substrate-binding protein
MDASTAIDAFKRIYEARAAFVSRGDGSGTHLKELSLWKEAGIDPRKNPNYFESGQGMAETLRIASEKKAYTLTDPATFLTTRGLGLRAFFIRDKKLLNVYSVALVSKKIIGRSRYELAKKLYAYLLSRKTARKIDCFSKKYEKSFGIIIYEPFLYGD